MKTILTLLLSLVSFSAFAQGPIMRGPGTTNTPAAWTNAVISASASIQNLDGFGTNATFWVYDGSFVPQMVGTTFGSSFLWATKDNNFVLAITPSQLIVYTNTSFRGPTNWFTGDVGIGGTLFANLEGGGVTNVSIVTTTNLTVYNTFSGKSVLVQNLYSFDHTITNGIYFYTNSWAGPTNPIDMRLHDQYYDTLVPVHITGFQNLSNTVSQSVVLTLRNGSASNLTCWIALGVRSSGFTNSFTVLAGSDYIMSMRYSPQGPRTNAIGQLFL